MIANGRCRYQWRLQGIYKNLLDINKTSPDFDPTKDMVGSKQGSDVVIRKDNSVHEYRRNIVHLKKNRK